MSLRGGLRRFAPSSSPPPPPPPPKEHQTPQHKQRTSSDAVSVKSFNPKSPVRRKPLPSTATLSPTSSARNLPPPSSFPQHNGPAIEPLSVRRPSQGDRSFEYFETASTRDRVSDQDLPLPIRPLARKNLAASPPSPQTQIQTPLHPSLRRSETSRTLPGSSSADGVYTPSSRPTIRASKSNGALEDLVKVVEDMGLKPGPRPPPLRTESTSSNKSQSGVDQKKPNTPSSKFTSFFSRRLTISPTNENPPTDGTEQSKSPGLSPFFGNGTKNPNSRGSQDSVEFDFDGYLQSPQTEALALRCELLEAELREISVELAGSIKREMDLEDMVERLQVEPQATAMNGDRTSDYFSDSGASSVRPGTGDYNPKEEIERIKRESEQQRAQIKVDLSQKWQTELSTRKTLETHVQMLQRKLSQAKTSGDSSARAKDLEVALEDFKRRLHEERQTKENFEDLLAALRVELGEHRNQRDNLRDEVVPQLKSRIEGLEFSLGEAQKTSYDTARLQHELQHLRDENAALSSARTMNAQIGSISEGDTFLASPRNSISGSRNGAPRSNTFGLARSNSRAGLDRSNSTSTRPQSEIPRDVSDQLKAIETQRDALHSTVKYLLRRQEQQSKQFEKRLKLVEAEKNSRNSWSSAISTPRKGGYEKDVRGLRSEINVLRKRADDALEQKWQCEKGLAGLKMDLDRSKQETESLHRLLENRDSEAPEALSSQLEQALSRLQQQREEVNKIELLGSIMSEQQMADQLERSAERSEALSSQVKQQLQANSSLRHRLKEAIVKGERDQQASTEQINELQTKLKKLEDIITSAQLQSETAVMKHEEEIRVIRASHNAQLMRRKSTKLPTNIFSPTIRSPLSPMFGSKSPKLDKTTSGPGIALHQTFRTEYLQNKVAELEKALTDAEKEMGEVVGRMNTAQIGVAELEAERDEALRKSRKLEAAIAAEREKVKQLLGS